MNLRHFLIALTLIPFASHAEEWKHISGSNDILMQIDPTSIVELKDGSRKAWKEFIYDKPHRLGNGKKFSRVVMLSIYNCRERTVAPIQEVDYDTVLSGSVVNHVSTPQQQARFFDVVPGSFDEDAMTFVCNYNISKK